MTDEPEIPAAAREVIKRLCRVPQVWDLLLEDLDAEEKRKPQSHFKLRATLIGSFGKVVDARVRLKRSRRK